MQTTECRAILRVLLMATPTLWSRQLFFPSTNCTMPIPMPPGDSFKSIGCLVLGRLCSPYYLEGLFLITAPNLLNAQVKEAR